MYSSGNNFDGLFVVKLPLFARNCIKLGANITGHYGMTFSLARQVIALERARQ